MPYLTSERRKLVVIKVLRDHLSCKRLWIFNNKHFTIFSPVMESKGVAMRKVGMRFIRVTQNRDESHNASHDNHEYENLREHDRTKP